MNNVEIGLCFTLIVKMNKITANSLSPTCHGDKRNSTYNNMKEINSSVCILFFQRKLLIVKIAISVS